MGGEVGCGISTRKCSNCSPEPPSAGCLRCPNFFSLFFPRWTKSPLHQQTPGSLSYPFSLGQRSYLPACSPGLANLVPPLGTILSLQALVIHPTPSNRSPGSPKLQSCPPSRWFAQAAQGPWSSLASLIPPGYTWGVGRGDWTADTSQTP